MEKSSTFEKIDLPLPLTSSGKVREIYQLDADRFLLVTTDRISAFDRVLGVVPYKGQVLNQLTGWWMEKTKDIIPNHLIELPDPNAAVVRKAEPLPIEVIVRGYITGVTKTALWYRYDLGEREIYGHRFPEGMRKNQELPTPLITPTTKGGPGGHDERLTVAQVVSDGYLGQSQWDKIQDAAISLFQRGREVAGNAGLILVDTKYEFGRLPDGSIVLIDEIHTPDSSRFWLKDSYQQNFEVGEDPTNYDKEFFRKEYAKVGYRGDGEPPEMPDQLWQWVSERYIDLFSRLTGMAFQPGEYPVPARLENHLREAGLIA
jgi:phosphoribosylaminoimidazole-succinocarboxamide synthase